MILQYMIVYDVHWCSLCFISMLWFLFSASTSCHLRSVHAVFCHLQLGETWFIMGWRERRNPLNCLVDGNFKHCKKAAVIFNQSTSARFEFKELQPRDGTMEVEAPTTRHFPCWAWRAMDAGTCEACELTREDWTLMIRDTNRDTDCFTLWLFNIAMENGWTWSIHRGTMMIYLSKMMIFHSYVK